MMRYPKEKSQKKANKKVDSKCSRVEDCAHANFRTSNPQWAKLQCYQIVSPDVAQKFQKMPKSEFWQRNSPYFSPKLLQIFGGKIAKFCNIFWRKIATSGHSGAPNCAKKFTFLKVLWQQTVQFLDIQDYIFRIVDFLGIFAERTVRPCNLLHASHTQLWMLAILN